MIYYAILFWQNNDSSDLVKQMMDRVRERTEQKVVGIHPPSRHDEIA